MQTVPTMANQGGRPLTGRMVLMWLLGFFFVVFAANVVFIYYAVGTFPGLEVASSYKAGQLFETEVDAARAQTDRGWTVDLTTERGDASTTVVATFLDRDDRPERDLEVAVAIAHPAMTGADTLVTLQETRPGRYEGTVPVREVGRRTLVLTAGRDGERLFMSRNLVFLPR